MPLRDYRQGSSPGERSKQRQTTRKKIIAVAAIALLLIGTGVALSLKSQAVAVPTDPATLCPTKRPPSEVDVILLDVSDRFSDPQRLQLQNDLARLRDSIPRFGLIQVYTVDRLGRRVTEPVFYVCNPGTGADLNRIYQNPELARKKWDGFATKLTADIDRQISVPASKTSPIFEAIQATALRTFGKPEYDDLPKHLVIVSDLIQNVPAGLNMYDQTPSFASFSRTPYFSRVRSDLHGVGVTVYYLARSGPGRQGPQHLGFWKEYFQSQGAEVKSIEKIYGDK